MLERDWQGEWSLSEDKTGIILRDRQGQDVGIVPVAQGVPPAPDVVARAWTRTVGRGGQSNPLLLNGRDTPTVGRTPAGSASC
jgi:hypothetical protein